MKANPLVDAAITESAGLDVKALYAKLEEVKPNFRDVMSITDPDRYAALIYWTSRGTRTHSDTCLTRMRKDADTLARWVREYQAYMRAWPNACKTCGGTGMLHSAGSFWEPPMDEPCDDCVCQDKCPRCGAKTLSENDDTIECPACGFNEKSEPMPDESGAEFYCDCGLDFSY